jgi:hypothetical protein
VSQEQQDRVLPARGEGAAGGPGPGHQGVAGGVEQGAGQAGGGGGPPAGGQGTSRLCLQPDQQAAQDQVGNFVIIVRIQQLSNYTEYY